MEYLPWNGLTSNTLPQSKTAGWFGISLLFYSHLCLVGASFTNSRVPQRSVIQDYNDPSHEARLIRDLLSRYDYHGKYSRPLLNTGKIDTVDGKIESKVTVKFGLRLMNVNLHERDQVMKTSVWIRMQWFDEYLRWNKTNYSNITRVTLPYDLIWHPDVVLVNTAEAEEKERLPSVQVSHTGSVFWTPHAQFSSACLLDITNYPFDRHVCDMWFQSIAHSSNRFDLQPYHTSSHNTSFDLSTYFDSYKTSQAWLITDNTTGLFARPRDVGMMLMYSRRPALRFRLILQRRSGFHSHLLTVPCILLSFLVPVVFCLPPERPDRNTIAMSLFGSSLLLLLILSTEAPPSAASTPSLCFYYGYNILAIMASIYCSVLVIWVRQRGVNGMPVPNTVVKIFNQFLADVLRVARPNDYKPPGQSSLKSNDHFTSLDITRQWYLLSAVLDRLFFLTFLILNVAALIFLYPWE